MLPCIEKMRDTLSYQTALLAGATGTATLCLLLTNLLTAPAIAMRAEEDQLAGLAQVMPLERYQNDILKSEQHFSTEGHDYAMFTAMNAQGQVTGYVLKTESMGYAGAISLLIGTDPQGEILGVRVLSHAETPGLGDKIELAKSDWILAFDGHSLGNTGDEQWAVRKDGGEFDQFSGATITPRAIVNGVHRALKDLPLKQDLSPTEETP
ncbi:MULTISPECIES: electron transport complex subunit RsxG [Corallincola]|uniref:Ion-translocating oxidoreductase complex subunit G n=3 Tax=Corallincola TaxID=1775176 RepID=A0A368NQX0_9GAMM|nr:MULTISPECIES: electron transport complex subunit RsxG [Corallincola]RCU52546.1 electron transport complex subunit RsxG [Corallincola holothuriorum]TAA48262.1 electron transport complex subunit RsxG [Corallincola spongiicola]TCI02444.1 electron transport complex subunit RsxG [Corallincola luteus]